MSLPTVSIHYRRPPDRVERFDQIVLHESSDCTVTYLPSAALSRPVTAGGTTVLEPGAAVVWFTYPGRWYDIGRFHLLDDTFTGLYANVLTPVAMDGTQWQTTDLYLDVWVGVDGSTLLLDEAELDHAISAGWIDPPTAATARQVADEILLRVQDGSWPPDPVEAWTLDRARDRLAQQPPPG